MGKAIKLPSMAELRASGVRFDLSPKALQHWDPSVKAAADEENAISIFDPIGVDYWTGEGVTAKRISGALRAIGEDQPVTVNINSPGGDVFEGLAIYNLLREHKGKVTVKVLGVAASAASFIAMAGDGIQIARAAFFMIHNGWIMVAGNRNDLRAAADWLEPFDRTMADIYAARTGVEIDEVESMMDEEKWMGGAEAVDLGFADSLLPADEIAHDDAAGGQAKASAIIDSILAKQGMTRTERRKLLNEFKSGMPSAAGGGTPRATERGKPGAAADVPEKGELNQVANLLRDFKI